MARFLIVDDSLFQRKNLGKFVQQLGSEVVGEAANGMEALTLYRRLNPDLVFMDLVMPEMEGIDAVEKLLEIDRDAKIIVVSSLGYSEIVDKALTLGAKQFITKPINFEETAGIIRSVLEE
ncbi:MAG: response regulator [Nitrospirae bacterium]|nr:MAG: response regulator [Nitrospirota bacterium]